MHNRRRNWKNDSEMLSDRDVYDRTDADIMFGELLNALDELEKDNPNLVGQARHQTGPHEGVPLKEPSQTEIPTPGVTEQGVVRRYFHNLFKKHG